MGVLNLDLAIKLVRKRVRTNRDIDLFNYFKTALTIPIKSIVFNKHVKNSYMLYRDVLKNNGIDIRPIDRDNKAFLVVNGRPSISPLYKYGHYYIMEPASLIPLYILPYIDSPIVLDVAAAPGGKTFLLSNMYVDGVVVSNEPNRVRRRRLINNIDKYFLFNTIVTGYPGEKFPDDCKFDIVVFDAPCSSTSLIYKRYNDVMRNLARTIEFKKTQERVASNIFNVLKKGGILLYMTCTISIHECEEVVASLIDLGMSVVDISGKLPFKTIPGDTLDGKYPELEKTGYILPDINIDKFGGNVGTMYYALLRKA